jgi:hypothetical protein
LTGRHAPIGVEDEDAVDHLEILGEVDGMEQVPGEK